MIHENNLKDETRNKLLGLSQQPRKRRSAVDRIEEEFGRDINSTGQFNISILKCLILFPDL